ncbi:phage tail tape measure protein [Phyllobacterium sp. 628]|uniref:phage tail tape measure protein n=1 Tax=Phyllobacterium sp. 628 TaxID=2718938 RepID=UPI00166260B7|nr:phage tail tape measure protein [Phyllobacterium sp. 628]QND52400.1 phage tail tape measure protein [Phyllobacterium sp. 628]
MPEEMRVEIKADTNGFETTLKNLKSHSDQFGRSLTDALKGATLSGKSLDDVLRQLGLSLSGMALSAGLKPIQEIGSKFFSDMIGALGPAKPHAKGGIVSSPTYFTAGGSLGLMGEAGAEAIMPLTRGADGRLGVAAQGGGSPVQVVMHINTPDAASFRKSEAQLTGMLARAVRRGSRTL